MLEIDKIKTDFGYDFRISTDEGIFRIFFGGNLDLYWSCFYGGRILESPEEKVFYITKENYYLFSLIDDLYWKIKNCELFSGSELLFNDDDIDNSFERYTQFKEDFKYSDNRPIVDDRIEWHSDDFDYDEASVLRIEKQDERYKVIFVKGKDDSYFETYSVRFRNSGSRYDPYNVLFMKMYNKLSLYDKDFHQIHMEEYLYQKKLVKK